MNIDIASELDHSAQEMIPGLDKIRAEVSQMSDDQKIRKYLLYARLFAMPAWNEEYESWVEFTAANIARPAPNAFKFWLGRCWAWFTQRDNPYAAWPGRFNDFLARSITGAMYGVDNTPGVEWRKRLCQARARKIGVHLDGPLYPAPRRSARKRKEREREAFYAISGM